MSARVLPADASPGVAASETASQQAASRVVVSTARDAREWDTHVALHSQSTIYHRWAWRDVFEGAFGHAVHYVIARRGAQIVGGLPVVELRSRLFGHFGVSLPFVNYGGIVADGQEVADALVQDVLRWARDRRLTHVELRHLERLAPTWPAKSHKVAMWLPLAGTADGQWSALDRKVRNQIRKAQKSGLEVEHGGAKLLAEFYPVFARNMRDLGTPVYDRRFFAAVLAALPDAARVFVVRAGREAVAASITLSFRGTTEVPWASSLRAHSDKSPNMLLYWAMLSRAIESGCSRFDFGRSTPGEGTFQFKRQWGAEPHPLVWEYAGLTGAAPPDQSPKNPKFRLAIAAWQHLPVRVATWLGPTIVRNIP
jgi:FemAB-related protein (PEP-CTERM system-associated)